MPEVATLNFVSPQVRPAWMPASTFAWDHQPVQVVDPLPPTDPGGTPSYYIASYSGGSLVGNTFCANGGGHNDSSWNSVVGIDLSQDVLSAVALYAGSSSVQTDVVYYADGTPSSSHTSYHVLGITALNRLMWFTRWGIYGPGGGVNTPNFDGFDITTGQYDPAGTWTMLPVSNNNNPGAVCKDTAENVYIIPAGTDSLYKWTRLTDSVALLATMNAQVPYDTAMAHDPVNNRLVVASDTVPQYVDLGDNSVHNITWGGPEAAQITKDSSFFWCGDTTSFFFKKFGSSDFYSVHPTTYAVTALSISGTPPAEAADAVKNMYGRVGWWAAGHFVYCVTQANVNFAGFRTA